MIKEQQIPHKLFKYYPPARIDVLESRLVCFSSKAQLNDPAEGISQFGNFLPSNFSKLLAERILCDSKDAFIFDSVEKTALERGFDPLQARLLARSASENILFRSQAINLIDSALPAISTALDEVAPTEVSKASNKIGVFSMTENENSDQMWAYYADNGFGFAIEINSYSIFFENDVHLSSLKKVIYESRDIDSFFDADDTDFFCRKQSDWSHEKEWRAFKITDDCDLLTDSGHSLFRIPSDAISCIILGEKSTPELQSRANAAAHSNGWEIKIAQLPPGYRKRAYRPY